MTLSHYQIIASSHYNIITSSYYHIITSSHITLSHHHIITLLHHHIITLSQIALSSAVDPGLRSELGQASHRLYPDDRGLAGGPPGRTAGRLPGAQEDSLRVCAGAWGPEFHRCLFCDLADVRRVPVLCWCWDW